MEMEQFKTKFIEEANDLINQLEETLLDNENDLNKQENVNQSFRVMHTLKGVSSMYGFDHVGNLAHDLESIFDVIREGKEPFSKELFDLTLRTVDQFRKLLVDEGLDDKLNQERQEKLLAEIEDILVKVGTNSEVSCTTKPVKVENDAHREETFYIIFKPNENLLFRGINILRIFEELVDIGEYKVVDHAFKEHDTDNKDENAWGIFLVSDKGIDAIKDVFMFVLEDCTILKVSDNNLFKFDEFIANLDSIQKNEQPPIAVQLQENLEETIESINTKSENLIDKGNNINELIDDNVAESVPEKEEIYNQAEVSNNLESIKEQANTNLTSRISIDAAKLDRLMHLVSELVTTKSQLNLAIDQKDYTKLIYIAEKIENLSTGFRENALDIRLIPVSEMLMPFKRLIRDLSKSLGKEVKFITQGIDTELDKNVIDRLSEPVMHILRNCIDHGIESPDERLSKNKEAFGSIKFTSFYSGANVFIQIQDDGAGIDPDKIKAKAIEKGLITSKDTLSEKEIYDLLFQPGFSTAKAVTNVSGRGVGMDIVRKKIEEVRGEVEINSELGLGTFVTIKLHQTLSIIDTLLLQVEKSHYLVPLSDIELCDQASSDDFSSRHNKQVIVDNELVPYVSLRKLFNEEGSCPQKEKLVIINKNDKRIAIVADKIIGDHQAVLKPLGEIFQSQQFLSGASMLGDGSLALMLDTNKLVNKVLVESAAS